MSMPLAELTQSLTAVTNSTDFASFVSPTDGYFIHDDWIRENSIRKTMKPSLAEWFRMNQPVDVEVPQNDQQGVMQGFFKKISGIVTSCIEKILTLQTNSTLARYTYDRLPSLAHNGKQPPAKISNPVLYTIDCIRDDVTKAELNKINALNEAIECMTKQEEKLRFKQTKEYVESLERLDKVHFEYHACLDVYSTSTESVSQNPSRFADYHANDQISDSEKRKAEKDCADKVGLSASNKQHEGVMKKYANKLLHSYLHCSNKYAKKNFDEFMEEEEPGPKPSSTQTSNAAAQAEQPNKAVSSKAKG